MRLGKTSKAVGSLLALSVFTTVLTDGFKYVASGEAAIDVTTSITGRDRGDVSAEFDETMIGVIDKVTNVNAWPEVIGQAKQDWEGMR